MWKSKPNGEIKGNRSRIEEIDAKMGKSKSKWVESKEIRGFLGEKRRARGRGDMEAERDRERRCEDDEGRRNEKKMRREKRYEEAEGCENTRERREREKKSGEEGREGEESANEKKKFIGGGKDASRMRLQVDDSQIWAESVKVLSKSTSQEVTYPRITLAQTRLTSEF
ncbi:uncharacterized protein [Aristolochia californica]|uniref:uncharacterized protein n=1 Tax=Aristolochia californica TaxID=171875 RepID=UPI0035D59265